MISTQDLCVSYQKKDVLDHINLDIKANEIYGLIGLNGVGKTTLIKTILKLREPNKGDVRYMSSKGEGVAYASFRNRIAYLPERFEPPIFLLGNEFIRFSASLYKQKINEEDIRRAAESLELDYAVLDKRVNTYSKGMRQKLGLIATILTGCDMLILDEPMSGLDPQARVCVKEKIKALRGEGRTVFLSSHILSDLSELCDRVSVLHKQQIQYTGTPQELCSRFHTESLEQAFLQIIKKNDENQAKVIN
jgi:ABC-2 type transport system ATP-binding protein